jgi:hypothetical protein
VDENEYLDPQGKTWKFSKLIHYNLNTKSGDCGMLCYVKNSYMAGKIIGMHVAGGDGIGCSLPLTRELVDRNIVEHLKTSLHPRRMCVDARVPFSAQMNIPKFVDVLPENSLSKVGNCLSLGMFETSKVPTKTALCASVIAGALQVPNTKPAYLHPIELAEGKVDPMRKGIQKVLNVTKPIDRELLESCAQDVFSILAKNREQPRVYSFEEAITGTDDKYIQPLNRTSSPGYPYTLKNKGAGKRDWLGYDDYIFSEEVRSDVEELLTKCRNNQRGDVIWVATLKDERRPIEKVNQGKTRVFAAGPMHYTIACRQYFLDFVAHIMRNRIDNGIGVGTNPYNLDWHRTGVALSSKGGKVVAGDFAGFDGSLIQAILWAICDIINSFYDDDEENQLIREVLFEEILNANILVQGELIRCDHSQPSGNPLTVIVNSIFNQIVMRYAFILCSRKAGKNFTLKDFNKFVNVQAFGDDNVLNISDEIIDVYNQITITEALATIGLTYTDEGKTGELVPYRTLDDVKYLKRSFKVDGDGYFRGPLDIDVCREMTNWTREKGSKNYDATVDNCNFALIEFGLHGKSIFQEYRRKISEAFKKRNLFPHLYTWTDVSALIADSRDDFELF